MKKLRIVVLTGLIVATTAAAPAEAKTLPLGEARLQARIVMGDYALKRDDLGYPEQVKCRRTSKLRAKCSGVSTGEGDDYTIRCDFTAIVVLRKVRYLGGGIWEAKARLVNKACKKTQLPYLEESAARAAAKAEADRVAGTTNTTIGNVFRISDTKVTVSTEWSRPGGEFGPETCDMYIDVELVDSQIELEHDSPICY